LWGPVGPAEAVEPFLDRVGDNVDHVSMLVRAHVSAYPTNVGVSRSLLRVPTNP